MGLTILAIILMMPFILLCLYGIGIAWKNDPMTVTLFAILLLFLAGIGILVNQKSL